MAPRRILSLSYIMRGHSFNKRFGPLDLFTVVCLVTWGTFLESPEKPLVKLRLAYSVELVFSYVVKRIKIKITSKFRASRGLCFDDTKRIMSPRKAPEKFRDFRETSSWTLNESEAGSVLMDTSLPLLC